MHRSLVLVHRSTPRGAFGPSTSPGQTDVRRDRAAAVTGRRASIQEEALSGVTSFTDGKQVR